MNIDLLCGHGDKSIRCHDCARAQAFEEAAKIAGKCREQSVCCTDIEAAIRARAKEVAK
jgi:hypothetical protein